MLTRKMHMIVTAVVLISAAAWLPFALVKKDLNVWMRISLALVGILAFVILFERDMYLPFLADAVFPTSLLVPNNPSSVTNGQVVVSIGKLPPKAKVVYWAAETSDPRAITIKDWRTAYGDYTNAGVVLVNESGIATIVLRCPQPYHVSHFGVMNMDIPPHVHYRYELPGTKGMLSEVYTHEVQCAGRSKN